MANKEKLLAFTVKITNKVTKKHSRDTVCVHVLGLTNTVLPESEECGRNERSATTGTTNVLKRNWMDVFIRSVRNGKILLRLNRERIATELKRDVRCKRKWIRHQTRMAFIDENAKILKY